MLPSGPMSGQSDSVAVQVCCTECGRTIDDGTGRFNLGSRRYHVECYDVRRHFYPPQLIPTPT
jgi:hypothetical protein